MIRRAGLGLARAISIANAMRTRRRCCPLAWFLSQGELILAALTRARNSMIRRAGVGVPPVISTPDAISTPQRCCSTAWSLPPEESISASLLWRAQNCMLLRGRRLHQQPRRRQALRLARPLRLPQLLRRPLHLRRRKLQLLHPGLFPRRGFARRHRRGPLRGDERNFDLSTQLAVA